MGVFDIDRGILALVQDLDAPQCGGKIQEIDFRAGDAYFAFHVFAQVYGGFVGQEFLDERDMNQAARQKQEKNDSQQKAEQYLADDSECLFQIKFL